MPIINTDNFSRPDLLLFIESIECLARLEAIKKQPQRKYQAEHKMSLYSSQYYTVEYSSTPTSSRSEEEPILERIEEKPIANGNHQMILRPTVYPTLYNSNYSSAKEQEEINYGTLNMKCLQKSEHYYNEIPPPKIKKRKSWLNCNIFNLVRQKCKKLFGRKTYDWYVSTSWIIVPVV